MARVPLGLTEAVFQGALTARTLNWHHRKDCEGAARLALGSGAPFDLERCKHVAWICAFDLGP
jgi:hypothetical protein